MISYWRSHPDPFRKSHSHPANPVLDIILPLIIPIVLNLYFGTILSFLHFSPFWFTRERPCSCSTESDLVTLIINTTLQASNYEWNNQSMGNLSQRQLIQMVDKAQDHPNQTKTIGMMSSHNWQNMKIWKYKQHTPMYYEKYFQFPYKFVKITESSHYERRWKKMLLRVHPAPKCIPFETNLINLKQKNTGMDWNKTWIWASTGQLFPSLQSDRKEVIPSVRLERTRTTIPPPSPSNSPLYFRLKPNTPKSVLFP